MKLERSQDSADLILADGLERAVELHRQQRYDELGSHYDSVELESLPFSHLATPTYRLGFHFWDGWISAANHNWQRYEYIERDDWPKLAREVIEALRNRTVVENPTILRHFDPRSLRFLRRFWRWVQRANRA